MYKPVKHYVLLSLFLMLFYCHSGSCEQTSISKTKSQLEQLNSKIKNVEHTLTYAHSKQETVTQRLATIEKEIDHDVRRLHMIQSNIEIKTNQATHLQAKITDLDKQLVEQQKLLAHYVKTRYETGEYQPLKWLLNQEEPYKINRILSYYQYLLKSHQKIIEEINKTYSQLNENKGTLEAELNQTQQLRYQLAEHQHQLEQTKKNQTILIQTLEDEIKNNQRALQNFQKDKDNLAHLLESLSAQNTIHNNKPFAEMRKRLPLPLQNKRKSFSAMNQGVTFFADEGEVVTAIYPGKVVFSDWLRGYGLLLIIDHGQGYMTLYAHNQSLFKRKGQYVAQNEQIATVGHSGGLRENGLYFEIRHRGKAVPPLSWLSKN